MRNQSDELLKIEEYNFLSKQLTKYVGMLLYMICLSCNIMNMLTFFQQIYHSRACSLYLFIASACDFLYLNLDPLFNILQYGFNYNGTINSLIYCKIKSYVTYVLMITSGTLTILASVSQYLLSSENNARWYYTRRHIGIRCIKITFAFWLIVSIPIIFCSKHVSRSFENQRLLCSNPAGDIYCFSVRLIYTCLFNGFLPPLMMMIFGFLTQNNVQHLYRRSNKQSNRSRKINQQLAAMLILQSIKSIFVSMPFAIFNCYWLKTINEKKTFLFQARENLLHQILYLFCWNNYTSFFVYIYSSDIFRNQWIKAMKKVLCCPSGKRQRPYPCQINRRKSQL
jgi:hypothetical protein